MAKILSSLITLPMLSGCQPQQLTNEQLAIYAAKKPNLYLISTADFTGLGDGLHFDVASQQLFGKRLAKVYLRLR